MAFGLPKLGTEQQRLRTHQTWTALFHRCLVAMILGTGPPSGAATGFCHVRPGWKAGALAERLLWGSVGGPGGSWSTAGGGPLGLRNARRGTLYKDLYEYLAFNSV